MFHRSRPCPLTKQARRTQHRSPWLSQYSRILEWERRKSGEEGSRDGGVDKEGKEELPEGRRWCEHVRRRCQAINTVNEDGKALIVNEVLDNTDDELLCLAQVQGENLRMFDSLAS